MVISLDPHTVGEVLGDARTLAQATDTKDEAVDLVREASARIDRIRVLTRTAERRPRVVALEWLDPPFAAGHWTPQLIEFAGGEDALGFAGENSEQRSWEEVAAAPPEIVIVMPCGYDAEIAHREAEMHRDDLAAIGARRDRRGRRRRLFLAARPPAHRRAGAARARPAPGAGTRARAPGSGPHRRAVVSGR